MCYVPVSFYIGQQAGKLTVSLIGLLFKLAFWIVVLAASAVKGICVSIYKLLCFLLPKLWQLMQNGYHRYRQYQEERRYVR